MEIEAEKGEFAEGNKTMGNFKLEVQLEDLIISHDDASDKSADTWKTWLELREDENSIFSSFESKFDNRYQVLAITEDNSEEFDENNNLVLNPANINRWANHLALHANTKQRQQEYAFWVSLRPKAAVKAISEREN
jgi:outer membrane receptor for ferric coprogen and ferric-rhodotorulic acid